MQILVKLILNKVCLDDDNFGNDDTETIIHIRYIGLV